MKAGALPLPEKDASALVRIGTALDGLVRHGDPTLEARHAVEQALAHRVAHFGMGGITPEIL